MDQNLSPQKRFEDIIRNRKTEMKNKRETDLPKSVELARQIIDDLLEISELTRNGDYQLNLKVREQLADCYGILGGTYKRWAYQERDDEKSCSEKYRLSLENYLKGNEIESEIGKAPFYNKINCLIAQILADPQIFDPGSDEPEKKKFYNELVLAKESLIEALNTEELKNDVWRWADYGMLHVLLDIEDPESAYAMFVNLATESKTYSSVLNTLEPLSALPLPVQEPLREAVGYLKESSTQ
jgi:hypothetical protein